MLSIFTKNLFKNNLRISINSFEKRHFIQINQNYNALNMINFMGNQEMQLNKGRYFFKN